MLDKLWCLILAFGVGLALLTGRAEAAVSASMTAAGDAVMAVLGLSGVVCMWMGLLKIAEASGLTEALGRLLRPVVRRLFPSVPRQDPALDAITMNISANLLGLGNAATPCGLRAMAHLQRLNPQPEQATPAMVTLLALNTAGVTLLPTLVLGLRAQAGSVDPAAIVIPTAISSLIGSIFALGLDAALRRRPRP